MRQPAGAIAAAVLALSACTARPEWSERVDVAVELAERGFAASSVSDAFSLASRTSDELMLCVIGLDGAARCHHRNGIVSARLAQSAESATCPGADAVLRSPCREGQGCRFPGVTVPPAPFAVAIVELRSPRFGIPRHVVADAAVVSRVSSESAEREGRRLDRSVQALARCLAPGAGGGPARLAWVDRGACESDFCNVGRARVKLSRAGHGSRAAARIADRLELEREELR